MAVTTISAPDRTLLRSAQSIDKLGIWVTPLDVIQTGTVTSIPSFSPFVSVGISWAGSISAVSVGQLLKIVGLDGTLKAYAIVRKAPTSSILYLSQTPVGSAGYPTQIENVIAVTDTVTVYSHRPLWGLYSRIDGQRFYKQWDLAYTDQNDEPPPVANTGAWQAAFLEAGATTATFRLPRVGSNSSFVFGSATIDSYQWTLPSGVTFAAGYANTDAEIEVEAEAGKHLISLRVLDDFGKQHTAYAWLFVSNSIDTGLSLHEQFATTIKDSGQSKEGREISVTVTGENIQDYVYAGAGVLLREWPVYGDSYESLTEGVAIDSFIGYVSNVNMSHDGNIGTATFTVQSPYLYAANVVQPPQALREKATAVNWTQCTSVLSNPRGWLYYVIKWHTPTLLDMHDLDAPYTSPRRRDIDWSGGSLQDAMRYVADLIAGNIGSASDGTTVLRHNPNYMNQTNRDAVPTVMDWQDTDIQAPFEYTKRLFAPLQDAKSGGFATDGNTVKAWLGQKRWNQGIGHATLTNFTVAAAEGLARILEVIGHFFAQENADLQSLDATLTMNQDVLDPAYPVWVSLTVSEDFDSYGAGLVSNRFLVENVAREYTLGRGGILKTITLSLRPETFGQPGEEIPIKNWKAFQLGGYSQYTPVQFIPHTQSGYFGTTSLALVDDLGNHGITYDYTALEPNWTNLKSSVNDENINDTCVDFASPYFASGTNVLGLWIVTTSATSLNIWNIANVLQSLNAELVHTVTMADSTVTTSARIEHSDTEPDLVLVSFHDATGAKYARSTDGGVTWGATTRIGATITDVDANNNAPLGMAVDGARQLISAPFGTGDWRVYYASTIGGAFSVLTNSETSERTQPLIKVRTDTNDAYASNLLVNSNPNITFDAGSWPPQGALSDNGTQHWARSQSIWLNVGGVGSGGNPSNCIKWLGNSPSTTSAGQTAAVRIYFGGDFTPTQVDFDYYVSGNSDWETFEAFTGQDAPIAGLGAWHHASFAIVTAVDSGSILVGLRSTATINGSVTTMDIRLDNIEIQTTEPFAVVPQLFLVETFDATDTWTDISPDTGEAPSNPHDLAVDLVDNAVLNFASSNVQIWQRSDDAGASFTQVESSTENRAFFTSGDALLLGSTEGMNIVLDGETVEDRTGNLAVVWGSVGQIKRIVPLG